eukprot:6430191-Amphidinium_carterae.1
MSRVKQTPTAMQAQAGQCRSDAMLSMLSPAKDNKDVWTIGADFARARVAAKGSASTFTESYWSTLL